MNEKLLTDIGENYEYVRTIVKNEVELLKINASETIAKLLAFAIIGIIAFLGLTLIVLGLVIVLALFLSQILSSHILGILVTILIVFLMTLGLILFRKVLFTRPIAYAIFTQYEKQAKK